MTNLWCENKAIIGWKIRFPKSETKSSRRKGHVGWKNSQVSPYLAVATGNKAKFPPTEKKSKQTQKKNITLPPSVAASNESSRAVIIEVIDIIAICYNTKGISNSNSHAHVFSPLWMWNGQPCSPKIPWRLHWTVQKQQRQWPRSGRH